MTGRAIAGLLGYGFKTFVLRRTIPYLYCLVLTDACNLDCEYCQSKNTGKYHLGWDQAQDKLQQAYKRGHRFLVLTGGEPTVWRDQGKDLDDVAAWARELGFLHVMIATNGLEPFSHPQCSHLVTIDGPREVHNAMRQGSYDRILDNLAKSKSQGITASITLCKANGNSLREFARELAATNLFSSLSFNFLTHSPDKVEELGLPHEEKIAALDELWRLKKEGHPVLLSRAAYLAMKNNSWKRPIRQMELGTRDRDFTCCRDVDRPEVCENCGYSTCVEVSQMLALKPSAILQAVAML